MDRVRVATVWLGGCSGCHMSFLDLDEVLIDISDKIDLVYSPIADVKEFPENVDVTLVEGAICNEDNLELIHTVRERTKVLVSFGDCAVTGNVPAMRNPLGAPDSILQQIYVEAADLHGQHITDNSVCPRLLRTVTPVHSAVPVDVYLPGCPPSPEVIAEAMMALLSGERPGMLAVAG